MSIKIIFTKMQALGNDFVIINNMRLQYTLTSTELAMLAHRKLGIGCDQVLLLEPATDSSSDFYYKIYNNDGSVAQQCLNGARCIIKYLYINKFIVPPKQITLQTNYAPIIGYGIAQNIFVMLPKAQFNPFDVPFIATVQQSYYNYADSELDFDFVALAIGNPHAIIMMPISCLYDTNMLIRYSHKVHLTKRFPDGVNVSFCAIKSKTEIAINTYERGSGHTQSCGSAAAAAASVFFRDHGITVGEIIVNTLGGSLIVGINKQHLYIHGTAQLVFHGEFITE